MASSFDRAAQTAHAGWDASSLRDPHQQVDKARRVRDMFDAIAPTYERVNAVASLGMDRRWRRRAIAAAGVRAGDVVLDLCCGTGDMVRAFAGHAPAPRLVIGLDFAANMLGCGVYTGLTTPVALLRGDALRLPLADACVDVISCAFGIRNFQDLSRGFAEIARVIRPGGRVVLLEFTNPENAVLRWGHHFYTHQILPRIGRLLSRDATRAYEYLPRSIDTFETRQSIARRLEDAGFVGIKQIVMNLGSVVIHRAERPSE